MNITTTKTLTQLSRYDRDEIVAFLIKRYGITRGVAVWELANRITQQRKFISALGAINRSEEWFRRQRF